MIAEQHGLRIHEVPVDWTDDPDSRVDIVRTAAGDLRGIARMVKRLIFGGDHEIASLERDGLRRLGQWLRYASVSVGSTLLSMTVLASLLAAGVTTAGWANVIATSVGIVPSFELNRRWVWRHEGGHLVAGQLAPYAAFSFVGLGLSTLAVSAVNGWALHADLSTAARALASVATNVSVFGGLWLVQFALLDRVLFASRRRQRPAADTTAT